MRQSPIHLAFGFLLAIAGLPFAGCTLIGYAVGSSIDHGNPRVEAPVPSVTEMETGGLYRVVKIDSSVVIGTYVGIPEVENPYNDIQKSYNQWRDADSSRRNMPRCLDSLEITLDTPVPRYLRGRLDRMSTDSLWVVGHSRPRLQMRGISLHEVRTLTSTSGGRIEGQDLRNEAAGMVLPPATKPPPSTIVLMVDGSENALTVDSIAYVSSMDIPSSARWVWMGVGVLVDALVVGVTVYGFEHGWWHLDARIGSLQ